MYCSNLLSSGWQQPTTCIKMMMIIKTIVAIAITVIIVKTIIMITMITIMVIVILIIYSLSSS